MKKLLICLALLIFALPTKAQDCGDGLPCGPIPWTLPNYPVLITPTPLQAGSVATPTPTNTPTATWTPSPTWTPSMTPTTRASVTPFFDPDFIDDHISTAEALIQGTQVPVLDHEGEPLEFGSGGDAETFFAYAKGLATGETFGVYTPFIVLLLTIFGFSFMLAMFSFVLPFAALILGLLIKIIGLIIKAIRG